MPLSDHEQQLLDQLEKQLRSEDPRFARNISETQAAATGPGFSAKRFVLGILIALAGLAATILAISLVSNSAWWIALGVVGFGLMVSGMYWAFSRPGQRQSNQTGAKSSGRKSDSKGGAGFMSRLEDRWEKRQRGE
ncbi:MULTISPECIES: DUF3040 domain-containing protein [unclassified Brevibacterium]|jgi:hypothetical protein|uniref:DUF3040 domain-containing protein n=1 Tax=unclassified Brevibacterium TaxID=2614124 RepID=UPI001BAD84C0|nr:MULTISPECIES: DUF3040 domain-containing protein [unclassified Brevibacterium]QUL80207.1 DUF3040 domain-containing protein [Brevibacterium sp. SMBL_HHYL_HB1]HJA61285.1 DUF3040 domain-containing protein [Candidatus Brevibacterium intestinavium]